MTKTLTEQWREGTLEQKYYYVKYFGNGQKPFVEIELKNFLLDLVKVKDRDKIEVLATVPNYTELTLMEGNYTLAKKALRDCYNEMKYWATMNHRCSKIFNHIKAALVEIEEIK